MSAAFPWLRPFGFSTRSAWPAAFRSSPTRNTSSFVRGSDRLEFNYKDFVKGKKEALDQNIWLQNGDTILVK